MRLIGFMLLAMLLTSDSNYPKPPQHPDPESGNGLLEICTADKVFYAGICAGYIRGVISEANMSPAKDCPATASYWCIPPEAALGQIQDVIIKYMKAHPEERHRPSPELIVAAMITAFQCPEKH